MRFVLFFILAAFALAACDRREPAGTKSPARVTATAAYEMYFGPPPAVIEGEALAVDGFLPVAGANGKVRPIPLFMITKGYRPDLLVSHLLNLPEFSLPPGLMNPFPPGTRLGSFTVNGHTAVVELEFSGAAPTDPVQVQGIVAAIGHSLVQFPEIRQVRVTAGGTYLAGLAGEDFAPDPTNILPPEAPRPIAVAGTWENDRPKEVSVFFDRPVTVRRIRLTCAGGRELAGDHYRSVFDMAVIIHPTDPAQVAVGMPVTVEWQATDPLGRAGAGRDTFPLRRLDHP